METSVFESDFCPSFTHLYTDNFFNFFYCSIIPKLVTPSVHMREVHTQYLTLDCFHLSSFSRVIFQGSF